MIRIVCDICLKHLQNAPQDQPQLCERCMPFAQDYYCGLQQLGLEIWAEYQKRVEKYRNQFLQQRVTAKTVAPLKAV